MVNNGFERLAAIDTEMLGRHPRMGELLAERGELMGQIGTAGLNGADLSLDWLSDQHEVALGALSDLGFGKKVLETEVPAFEQVRDTITDATAGWLNGQRTEVGMHRRLLLTPSVQTIGLMGTTRKPGLIPRFDKKQDTPTEVRSDMWGMWGKFGDKAAIHDNGAIGKWQVGILLGDTKDPRDTDKPANAYNEPGLVFPGMTVEDQRSALKTEAEIQAVAGRDLRSSVVGDLVVANAQRRIEDKPLLDQSTATRLTHYEDTDIRENPDPEVYGGLYVPDVFSLDRQLELGRTDVRRDWNSYGVRRVLRVAVNS